MKKTSKFIFLLILQIVLIILPFQSLAKGEITNILEADKGYLTTLYNNANGLPTSEANTIVQTSDGFIWIGYPIKADKM